MPPTLRGLGQSILSPLDNRRADVYLFELDRRSDIIDARSPLAFQYFPETITDTKGVNLQQKEIPGGSLPLYQWVASGERLLSFTAEFSADEDVTDNPQARLGANKRRSPDIRTAVLWLRRFLMPSYLTGRTYAPNKLRLHIPNSGIGLAGGGRSAADVSDHAIYCLLTQCEITWESFFPSGVPQLVQIQLSFAQVAQFGGRVFFPSVTPEIDSLVFEGGRTSDGGALFAYNVRPRQPRLPR